MAAPEDTNNGRATLRDLAEAQKDTRSEVASVRTELSNKIDEVRTEIGDKVDGLSTALSELKDGLLPRVSVLESDNEQNKKDLRDHNGRLNTLEVAHQRALGHLSAWKVAAGVFGGAASIVLADVIYKALGG